MNISSLQNTNSSYSQPHRSEKSSSENSKENIPTSSSPINVRDISIDEINTLIKSGKTELLDFVPLISPHTADKNSYNPESIENNRVDLLGQIEKMIDFKKSIGGNPKNLEKIIASLKEIDGNYLPKIINATA